MSDKPNHEEKRIAADILIAAINNDLFDLSRVVLTCEDDVSEQASFLGTAYSIILEGVLKPPA